MCRAHGRRRSDKGRGDCGFEVVGWLVGPEDGSVVGTGVR